MAVSGDRNSSPHRQRKRQFLPIIEITWIGSKKWISFRRHRLSLGFLVVTFRKSHGGMGCDGVYHSHEVDGTFVCFRDISHIFQVKILKGRLYVETRVIWLHPNLINSFLLAGRFPKNSLSRSLTISPRLVLSHTKWENLSSTMMRDHHLNNIYIRKKKHDNGKTTIWRFISV